MYHSYTNVFNIYVLTFLNGVKLAIKFDIITIPHIENLCHELQFVEGKLEALDKGLLRTLPHQTCL